ncbi:hypothetical protein HK096_002666 [Nowakowskiella sp. JEL0078]|nr:hypothetical protein HK096_002666 [Nowakowskiella sp. JEL0078]
MQVCQFWNSLIKYTEIKLWRDLCQRKWFRNPEPGVSGKYTYKLHQNVSSGRYMFANFAHSAEFAVSSSRSLSPIMRDRLGPSFLTAWATDPSTTLLCSVRNMIVWMDNNARNVVKAVQLGLGGHPLMDTNFSITHKSAVQLLLGTDNGLLISFDDSSSINVWDMIDNPGTHVRTIKTENVMTMNVHNNFIVCCNMTGKITVWDAISGEVRFTHTIPAHYIPELNFPKFVNVGIWDNYLLYGCYDGQFYSYNITTGKQLATFNVLDVDPSYKNRELAPNEVMFAPMAMSLSGSMVLTNGPGDLTMWDYTTGKLLYKLNKSGAERRRARHVESPENVNDDPFPSFKYLQMAEISRDGTLISGLALQGETPQMLVWDFSRERRTRRVFEHQTIPNGHGNGEDINFWICFDE